jgi:basic membrane lipoprotein Med (substrate-binding protein (PBP1-ABC) superfamily)
MRKEAEMKKSRLSTLALLVIGLALAGSACGPQATAAPTPAPAAATEPPAANAPEEVRMAVVVLFREESWTTALVQSLDRVVADPPHGLKFSYQLTEDVPYPEGERVIRQLAESGQFDIIWGHSTYSPSIKPIHNEFPEILFEVTGAGNEAFGGNVYWFEVSGYEPTYLLGIMAGMMTETDTIGAVGEFPFPNVNLPINSYIEGAKSVNPDIQYAATYIESWFDPPKAQEAALAQIGNGADFILGLPVGPIEACVAEQVYCFGYSIDQHEVAPGVVLSSGLTKWDPHLRTLIDVWYDHEVNGTPYNAPLEPIIYKMAEGGSDIAPYHGLESQVPDDVKAKVEEVRQAILGGEFEVPFNEAPIE